MPKVKVYLSGGLGNQLFQLAAGLFLSNSKLLTLDSSYGNPRINSGGSPQIADFELPTEVNFRNSRRGKASTSGFAFLLRLSSHGKIGLISRLLFKVFNTSKSPLPFLSNGVGFDEGLHLIRNKKSFLGCFHTFRWPDHETVKSKLQKLDISDEPEWLKNLYQISTVEKPLVIHIRKGDYKSIQNLDILNLDYYIRGIAILKANFPDSKLWIFSDDFEAVKDFFPEHILSEARLIDYESFNSAANLQAMRFGHGYLIANSTYSWWGAYLSYSSSPLVLYPSTYFADSNSPRDLYPEYWTQLEVLL